MEPYNHGEQNSKDSRAKVAYPETRTRRGSKHVGYPTPLLPGSQKAAVLLGIVIQGRKYDTQLYDPALQIPQRFKYQGRGHI
jgi:DNA-binding sugar fermentation-stimulating protein